MGSVQCSTKRPLKAPSPAAMRPSSLIFPNVRKAKRSVPLAIMFTDPPLATIGATPSDAMAVGSNSYADQGRAKV
jgi:dihydrolipoamide dehydrogenase